VTKPLERMYVLGAGGHSKVAIRAAQLNGKEVIAVFDDSVEKLGTRICGVPVVGTFSAILKAEPLPTFIAIGDNQLRLHLANQLDLSWATIIHPAAVVDDTVKVGAGVLVLAGAVVQVDAKLGDHTIINNNATIEHDCYVEAGAHISCNACLAGEVLIGNGTLIGVGASVLPRIRIGEGAVVGGGAVVVQNLKDRVTAIGVPAKIVESNRKYLFDGV